MENSSNTFLILLKNTRQYLSRMNDNAILCRKDKRKYRFPAHLRFLGPVHVSLLGNIATYFAHDSCTNCPKKGGKGIGSRTLDSEIDFPTISFALRFD